VLKRLADAVSDRDTIHAIIKGSALSNDGSSKVGYTAPSIEGQARAISMAQSIAGVNAETISYIEAHGTGTALGDPAEIDAPSGL
jgi:acyl transferase domain-containing protein